MTREEALEYINNMWMSGETHDALEVLIPEFGESEDERIRKALLEYFGKECDTATYNGIYCYEIYAWLEKQKDLDKMIVVSPEVWDNAISDAFENGKKEGEKQKESLKDFIDDFPYSDEQKDNKFAPRVLPCSAAWFEDGDDKQKEQKPAECLKAERDGWYVCIKDFYAGGKKQCSVGDLVQAKGGMYMMGNEDISEWFRRAYYEDVRDAFGPNTDTNIPEQKPEWSEQDKENIVTISEIIEHCTTIPYSGGTLTLNKEYKKELLCFIKSLRPSWKPSEEQMEAFEDVMTYIPEFYKPKSNLASLLRDLKKQV